MTNPEMAAGPPPIDYGYYLDTYGLGPAELNAEVTFGSYTGTVASMLNDGRCPVGGMVAEAYASGGIVGVEQKLTGFNTLDSRFNLQVSETTQSYHRGEAARDDVLHQIPAEKSDFLA